MSSQVELACFVRETAQLFAVSIPKVRASQVKLGNLSDLFSSPSFVLSFFPSLLVFSSLETEKQSLEVMLRSMQSFPLNLCFSFCYDILARIACNR